MNKKRGGKTPTIEELERELKRVKYQENYRKTFWGTISTLITVAAIAVLIAMLVMPVLRIYGTSMRPTLENGEIVLTIKTTDFEKQDVIAFYYNNKILVKRIIACPGEWINIDVEGNVFVDDQMLHESYLKEKVLGECDLEFPYQVPDGRYFVMGDYRSVSMDSRSSAIGCISEEQMIGKLIFRVWPFDKLGTIN